MSIINFTFNPGHNLIKEEKEWLDCLQEKTNAIIQKEMSNLQVFERSDVFNQTLIAKEDNKEFNNQE